MNDLRGDKLSFAKTHPVNMSLISLASQPVRETKLYNTCMSFIQTAEIKNCYYYNPDIIFTVSLSVCTSWTIHTNVVCIVHDVHWHIYCT